MQFGRGSGRGVLHFLVLVHIIVVFVLVAGEGGLETWRGWLDHGCVCCFEIRDALLKVAEVLDACLLKLSTSASNRVICRPQTERIASLCISWSLHAGIMSFKTANSSFIFDLRLRSMTLWAVFRAIFFPAALVELGCFLPMPLVSADTAHVLVVFLLFVRLGRLD